MVADRTVPCDHSIRRESSWKAESVIGWSAAQHELGGSGCSNCDPNGQILLLKLHRKEGWNTGEKKAPTEVRLSFIYCTQVRPPGGWRTQKK